MVNIGEEEPAEPVIDPSLQELVPQRWERKKENSTSQL